MASVPGYLAIGGSIIHASKLANVTRVVKKLRSRDNILKTPHIIHPYGGGGVDARLLKQGLQEEGGPRGCVRLAASPRREKNIVLRLAKAQEDLMILETQPSE